MKLEIKAFRTKVARRIFVLFILCAILPITALALVSYMAVKKQLLEQCQFRLRQDCKDIAISLYQRLWLIRSEMNIVASNLRPQTSTPQGGLSQNSAEDLKTRFDGVILVRGADGVFPLLGNLHDPPTLSPAEKRHLQEGKAVLSCRRGPDSAARIFMAVSLDPEQPEAGILLGEIKSAILWEASEGIPPGAQAWVLDRGGHIFYATAPGLVAHLSQAFREITLAHSGNFEWSNPGNTHYASYWTLFLAPNFLFPEWIIVVSEPETEVFAPVANFKRAFAVIAVLSLGMVFFLSFHLVQRSTVPIEILREATRKIAKGLFGERVEIRSGDEFEGLAESFNDMSAKIKESQSLLVKAAKLSTMGQMSAGIMHEIKQPLSAISGLLQLAMLDKSAPDSKKRLKTALTAVDRLNGILQRFKSFSHMSDEVMQTVSLKEVLDQVVKLLEHQLAMNQVKCTVEHAGPLPAVKGDPQSLQQVFSNLLINASDALEERKDAPRLIQVKTRPEEGKVIVEVRDNGCGIPKEIQKMIFDPFFTTKPPEKGTGLGMAIIESILDKHHAGIELESEVGVGTRFTVHFPALPSPAPAAATLQTEKAGKESP
ncbi:MAG: ATP-binding protein [Thermodesulfobacteriota bacterium]